MDERPEDERLERAAGVYEDVRLMLEQIMDVEAELDAPDFDEFGVTTRAQEYLENARISLEQLAELMQNLHLRPGEDASDEAYLDQ